MFKPYNIKILILLITLLVTACAINGPLYVDAPLPKGGDALVYIYRLGDTPPYWRDAYFYINDVNIVDLSRNGYTWFHVPAGKYILRQRWSWDVNIGFDEIIIPVKWQSSQKIYYRLSSSASRMTYKYKSKIDDVPEAQALKEIRDCRFQPVFGLEKFFESINSK